VATFAMSATMHFIVTRAIFIEWPMRIHFTKSFFFFYPKMAVIAVVHENVNERQLDFKIKNDTDRNLRHYFCFCNTSSLRGTFS
jgi:hypothetical protein